MHATENHILRFRVGRLLRELEGITSEISEFYNFIALIVMAQNHHILTKFSLGRSNPIVEPVVGDQQIGVKIAANAFFDFRSTNESPAAPFRRSELFDIWVRLGILVPKTDCGSVQLFR